MEYGRSNVVLLYALLTYRPLRSLSGIYSNHLESPGTKAYSISEACQIVSEFAIDKISTRLIGVKCWEATRGGGFTNHCKKPMAS
jgi:hypothetical protein